ncbi:MAG: thioredoxin family protein [Planctomycetota bacterium]
MQSRRRWITAFCAAGFLAGVAWAQEQKPQEPAQPAKEDAVQPAPAQPAPVVAKVGRPAPEFTLLDTAGDKHALADLKDKVVVLVWMNKDCPFIRKCLPELKKLAAKHADQVVWLSIDSTADRTAEVNAKFVEDEKLPFPVLVDADQKVARLYAARTTPHVFVINKGTLVYRGALDNNPNGDKKPGERRPYVDEAVNAVLAGKTVPLAETPPWGCTVKYKESKAQKESA